MNFSSLGCKFHKKIRNIEKFRIIEFHINQVLQYVLQQIREHEISK
jgi:hypothetical protein